MIIILAIAIVANSVEYMENILDKSISSGISNVISNYYLETKCLNDDKQLIEFVMPINLPMQYVKDNFRETELEMDWNDYSDDETTESSVVIVSNEENLGDEQNISQNDNQNNENTDNTENNSSSESNTETTTSNDMDVANIVPVNNIDYASLTFDDLMRDYYTVTSTTVVYESDLEPQELLAMDMKMKQDNQKPQILIYHTHGQEGFVDTVEGDESTRIVGVGTYLTELLQNKYGYNVIHIKDSFDLVNGKLDRSKAYDYAYNGISKVLEENPSIEVVLDIHRDGVNDNLHLATEVNGKPTAKIMFFNGMSRLATTGDIDYLYNPNLKNNLSFSLQMKLKAEEYFPDFTRKNYVQAYEYNLQVRPKSMLIEVGAQTNTVEEEKNAMEPLSELLHLVLG